MRLPSHSYDTLDLVRNMSIPADGPEQVITADEYLHPQSAAARHQRGLTAAGGKIPYHINGALELVRGLNRLFIGVCGLYYVTAMKSFYTTKENANKNIFLILIPYHSRNLCTDWSVMFP